jgi:uncharacterized protein YdeI (YjbR/CyaY-like superfamily)
VEATFFTTQGEFRAWLEANHETAPELLVGFRKTKSGLPSMTWPESVDQALCFGWIDGIRRRIDDTSYSIRFTPRRSQSIWSVVNIARFGELESRGLVVAAGRRAFERRSEHRSGVYSHEQAAEPRLDPAFEERLRADGDAWAFLSEQSRTYRRAAAHWVMSAKREETRERRLVRLIEDSAAGRTVPPLTWGAGGAAASG